jgi:hypothetical protein
MGGQVVEHDDIISLQRRYVDLFNIGDESRAGHRVILPGNEGFGKYNFLGMMIEEIPMKTSRFLETFQTPVL